MLAVKKALVSITLFSVLVSYSQTYSTSFEEEVFLEFKKDSINYNFFESLFAIDTTITKSKVSWNQEKVDNILKIIPPNELKSKKEKKRIKQIYDIIHDEFFKKYDINAFFNDIFENGNYNCVTATALYVYVFEKLNIPFHVKETPSHVFLIVYPYTHRIYLETTAPGELGFLVPNEADIKKIINELIDYKLVTIDEVQQKGYMKFYEDYYYGKEFVDKKELIGMQYYNSGISGYESEDYATSINNLKKAQLFYNSPVVKLILKDMMFSQINSLEFNTKEDVLLLIDLISITEYKKDYKKSNLSSSLYKITDHDDNDIDFILYVIKKFEYVENEEVKQYCLEFLYKYLARNYVSDEDLSEALKYSSKLLSINPNSKLAKQVIEYVCYKKVLLSTYDIEALEGFQRDCETYQFLKENKRHNISLVHLYGNISFTHFKNKEINEAKNYLKKMELILDNNDVLDEVNRSLLSGLYLKAGNHYYYKDQYSSSYKIFKKGLEYVPNNSELIKKAKWSKEEL